ncbi:MAG TPA: methyltransferase domain-containing protein [Pseudohongiella sp.]|nr:methyltransferase domain-containing protein [Pseudohongiella sp.]
MKTLRAPVQLFARMLAASLLVSSLAASAAEHPGYEFDTDRSRGGIGKFYMDREISGVMGHQAAGWLERTQRTHEEMPDEVVANLDLQPDDIVADIGAGTGYFSFRIAEKVPLGKVLATDIQPEMLAIIEQRKQENGVANVETILGGTENPNLPPNSVDKVLFVDVYHELSHPFEMMQGIYDALRPGGKLFLIEYRAEDDSVPIRPLHKMSEEQVVKEMSVFGLNWDDTLDFLPWQHMFVFSKPE